MFHPLRRPIKVEDYIRVFEPYRETYKANNEHMTIVKTAYANSSLEEFRATVEKYKGMTEDFEAIPSCATVCRREGMIAEGGGGGEGSCNKMTKWKMKNSKT